MLVVNEGAARGGRARRSGYDGNVVSVEGSLDRETSARVNKRRRARSLAMLIVLLALATLFFAITIVKMGHL
ncbi:MAG TPA: hypothetical protein VHC04_12825 [Rhodopila sp.]|nr:hypothetical protein [Rhodopila sp.]